MKNLVHRFWIFFLVMAFHFSCKQQEDIMPAKGNATFSMSSVNRINNGGRIEQTETPVAVLLGIEDGNGNSVVENKKLSLFTFGNGYVSESLELTEGSYKLVQFQVLNADDVIIYASPMTGSDLAKYVTNPLPLNFTITKEASTQVIPQVLAVLPTDTPESFGFVNFGFEVVELPRNIPIHFLVPTLSFFETKGYDSVIVTFEKDTERITKNLNIISPIEATGNISTEELQLDGSSWSLTVQAYHEAIDEVLFNMHVVENKVSHNISLPQYLEKIEIDNLEISFINEGSELQYENDWSHISHLTDDTGYFHLIFDNDFCSPEFTYEILKPNVEYVSYEKFWLDKSDTGRTRYADAWNVSQGSYTDVTTFSGIDCESISLGTYPDTAPALYFELYNENINGYYCYLVWQQANHPYDPVKSKSGRISANNNSQGYFRVTNDGIEKFRNEARERFNKHN